MAFGTNWSYNFGTGTGNYATPANSSSTTFLPAPSTNGGTARIYLGNGGGAFNLNNQGLTNLGTDTELKITASTSENSGHSLESGVYKFAVQLEDNEGNKTNWGEISQPIYIGSKSNQAGEQTSSSISIN
mgnify:CR=1 FL=1